MKTTTIRKMIKNQKKIKNKTQRIPVNKKHKTKRKIKKVKKKKMKRKMNRLTKIQSKKKLVSSYLYKCWKKGIVRSSLTSKICITSSMTRIIYCRKRISWFPELTLPQLASWPSQIIWITLRIKIFRLLNSILCFFRKY